MSQVTNWKAELNARLKLARFNQDAVRLMELIELDETKLEGVVKLVDECRGEWVRIANLSGADAEFAKAGKLGKDGNRKLSVKAESVSVKESIASEVIALRIAADAYAKACRASWSPLPADAAIRKLIAERIDALMPEAKKPANAHA